MSVGRGAQSPEEELLVRRLSPAERRRTKRMVWELRSLEQQLLRGQQVLAKLQCNRAILHSRTN